MAEDGNAENQFSPNSIPTDAIAIGEEVEPDTELKDNQYIASTTKGVGIYSFVDSRQQYIENCPPPKYLTEEMLTNPLPVHKEDILKGFITPAKGGLICID